MLEWFETLRALSIIADLTLIGEFTATGLFHCILAGVDLSVAGVLIGLLIGENLVAAAFT